MEQFLEQVYNGFIAMGSDKCDVNEVVAQLSKFVPEVKDKESLTKYICDNAEMLKHVSISSPFLWRIPGNTGSSGFW